MIFAARRSSLSLGLFMAILGLVVVPSSVVHAQDKPAMGGQPRSPEPCMVFEQMQLTEAYIAGLLASADEVNTIRENGPGDVSDPAPETVAKLDTVARKNGLASYDEFKTIRANVLQVMSGYDDVTDKYVGMAAVLRLRAARVKADRKMSPQDKKQELEDLGGPVCVMPRIAYRGNIDLVHKYYKRLRPSAFQN
jgi:hypothetical protein